MTTPRSPRYELIIDDRAQRQLARLSKRDLGLVRQKILALRNDPHPPRSLKLRGEVHRVRAGNWRVFYVIDNRDQTVIIKSVQRRNERTYRDL